jgi:hypothetical protein
LDIYDLLRVSQISRNLVLANNSLPSEDICIANNILHKLSISQIAKKKLEEHASYYKRLKWSLNTFFSFYTESDPFFKKEFIGTSTAVGAKAARQIVLLRESFIRYSMFDDLSSSVELLYDMSILRNYAKELMQPVIPISNENVEKCITLEEFQEGLTSVEDIEKVAKEGYTPCLTPNPLAFFHDTHDTSVIT